MTLPIIIDRRRQRAAMQREAPDDTDGQAGGGGPTTETKAHAMSAGPGHLRDPRERILEAARQVERSPFGKSANGTENGHEYMTD